MKKTAGSPARHSHVPRTEPHGQVLIGEDEEEEEEEENEEEKEEEEEEEDDDDQEPLQVKQRGLSAPDSRTHIRVRGPLNGAVLPILRAARQT